MEKELKYASTNIKLLLKSKGWTQSKLCEKTGMAPVTLAKRLNREPDKWKMTEAISIAKAFGVPVSEIFLTKMIPKGNTNEEKNLN